ncbi:hypothetical protein CCR75_009338 [Bremia lactucae]|uniref:WRKY19-like zinc finger domain-containing protein n=1 Tax=Bremia lactucae TaxID=4779 RepID=A0A976IER8_BRELC|nr:hypothetical protein CCR75_009338 [Bremia lactucae]
MQATGNTAAKAALAFSLSWPDTISGADDPNWTKRGLIPNQTNANQKSDPAPASFGPAAPSPNNSVFCYVKGCTSRANYTKRCWKHSGSVKCKKLDCVNRAKSKGVCWSHGGGTACSYEECDTIAVSNNLCWAHGGGKRCQILSCSKPAYERTQDYCQTHYKEFGENLN